MNMQPKRQGNTCRGGARPDNNFPSTLPGANIILPQNKPACFLYTISGNVVSFYLNYLP